MPQELGLQTLILNTPVLKRLTISKNYLRNGVDFSRATPIEQLLWGADRSVTEINLSPLTGLKDLQVTANHSLSKITGLASSAATLTTLTVTLCPRLYTLDVTGNPALTDLLLTENALVSLDLTHNTKITTLDVRNNKLAALDLSVLPGSFVSQLTGNKRALVPLMKDGRYYLPKDALKDFVNSSPDNVPGVDALFDPAQFTELLVDGESYQAQGGLYDVTDLFESNLSYNYDAGNGHVLPVQVVLAKKLTLPFAGNSEGTMLINATLGGKEYKYFRSYSSPVDLNLFGMGVGVFFAKYKPEEGKVTLTRVSEDYIPASTGVILAAEASTYFNENLLLPPTQKQLTVSLADASEVPTFAAFTNELEATISGKTFSSTDARLHFGFYSAEGDDKSRLELGFYKPKASYLRLPANTSYLPIAIATAVKDNVAIEFADGTTTGIDQVRSNPMSDAWYTLQGARIAQPTAKGNLYTPRQKSNHQITQHDNEKTIYCPQDRKYTFYGRTVAHGSFSEYRPPCRSHG